MCKNHCNFNCFLTSIVTAPIVLLESFLDASFEEYSQIVEDRPDPIRFHRANEYSLPMTVAPHIYRVYQAIDIPPAIAMKRNRNRAHTSWSSGKHTRSSYLGYVTPSLLNSYYSITSNTGSSNVAQTVYAAIGQTFSPRDVSSFQKYFGIPSQTVSTNIGKISDRQRPSTLRVS